MKETYVVDFSLFSLRQALRERAVAEVKAGMWLRAVADKQFVFNRIVQITGFLEDSDVNLEEQRKPA